MKYNKKYLFAACAALLLGMQSCDLEEYNPAGSTPDNVYKEQAGFEALVRGEKRCVSKFGRSENI